MARYNTGEVVHQKQLDFHKCLKRNRWVFGGNRSGKTECGAVEGLYGGQGEYILIGVIAKTMSGWIVSLSYEVQREVAQSKFLSYLNPDWIEDVVMLSGKKGSAEYGIIDCVLIKTSLEARQKLLSKVATRAEKNFKARRLTSFGLTKNLRKTSTTSAVCESLTEWEIYGER